MKRNHYLCTKYEIDADNCWTRDYIRSSVRWNEHVLEELAAEMRRKIERFDAILHFHYLLKYIAHTHTSGMIIIRRVEHS